MARTLQAATPPTKPKANQLVAYLNSLKRAGGPASAEEDWLKAVNEARTKYTR